MKKIFMDWFIPILLVIVAIFGYLYFNNPNFSASLNRSLDSPPYITYKDGSLYIDEFKYTVGMNGFNVIDGDFERLNEKVYKVLKGESGLCTVYIQQKHTDKYGISKMSYQNVGTLDLNELNNYTDLTFWQKSEELQELILGNNPPINVNDSDLQKITPKKENERETKKSPSNIPEFDFTFNTSKGASWQYFTVTSEGLEKVNDLNIVSHEQFWKEFSENISKIKLLFYPSSVDLTITYEGEASTFKLQKFNDEMYNNDEHPTLTVRRYQYKFCDVYFLNGDKCLMINNEFLSSAK